MGCGHSDANHGEGLASTPRDRPYDNPQKSMSNGHARTVGNAKISPTDSNANRQDVQTNNPVQKSVAFEVNLDGEEKQSLIKKHPPLKLKRLEPLDMPTLTPELLAERQRLADEKRDKELQRKISASRKSSKRRRELMMAKEFELQQQQKQEEQKLKAAEKLRESRLNDIKEKQRIREERGKRAREKAKRIHNADQEDLGNIEVEKDDQFNADDVDSWLDGDNNNHKTDEGIGERIYSGHSSPTKNYNEDSPNHRYNSASTVDSYDNAFSRKPPSASVTRQTQLKEEADDDFYS